MLSIKNHRNNNKNYISTSNIQSISELNLTYPSDSITVFERSVTENRRQKNAQDQNLRYSQYMGSKVR